MTGDDGNFGPMLPIMDQETEAILAQLERKIKKTNQDLDSVVDQLARQQIPTQSIDPTPPSSPIGYYPLEVIRPRTQRDLAKPGDGSVTGVVLDNNRLAFSSGLPELVPAKVGNGLKFKGEYDELYLDQVPNFEWTEPFSGGMWMNTTKKEADKTQTLMGTAGQKNNFWRGWDFYLDESNRLNFRIIHSLPHNYIHIQSLDSMDLNTWRHVFFTYDGSGKAAGVKLFIDGTEANSEVRFDQLYKSAKTVNYGSDVPVDRAVRVAKSYRAFTGEDGVFKGVIDEISLYGSSLTELEVMAVFQGNHQRPDAGSLEDAALKQHWIDKQPQVKSYKSELKSLRDAWLKAMNPVEEVMVMEEMETPRPTYAYKRGSYADPMYPVTIGTPEILGEFPEDLPQNRLGLAEWLFKEDHPLTARVTVNRYWQLLFGTGLVSTPQDFGVQGALPTHPELLDWLAVYFVESQWNVKQLLKLIVLSNTYQQSSKVTEEQWNQDPQNVWLARGASYRLSAEMIRDNALAASGLLVSQVGGSSVRPYQPEGLWIDKGNFSKKLLRYKITPGDSLYRRSLYTFIKRTSPHPAMTAFDAPNRDVCTVKREKTNTPLQALVLMNDPQFVECARVLATKLQRETEGLENQIVHGFRSVTGRKPTKEEIEIFTDLYHTQLDRFRKDGKAVDEILSVGQYPTDTKLQKPETAALAVVASTMINHDEAYMKR